MTQFATVKKIIDENTAEISVVRESSCGKSCVGCSGCSEKKKTVTALANNLCDAKVGDVVCVEMPTKQLLGITVFVYLVPLVLFFAACFVSAVLGAKEGVSILLGFVAMAFGFVIVRLGNKRAAKKNAISFNIISVVSGT